MSCFLAAPVMLAHFLVGQVLMEGDCTVDATAGNGHDTLFLAQCVGDRGRVYVFDIQEDALERTAARLTCAGLMHRVSLIHAGHERIKDYVPAGVKAVMFNLGYLPGGNHRIITQPSTTLAALEQALQILAPEGIVTIVIYRGHVGGEEESFAISRFVRDLKPKKWVVVEANFLNRSDQAPFLIVIQKMKPSREMGV